MDSGCATTENATVPTVTGGTPRRNTSHLPHTDRPLLVLSEELSRRLAPREKQRKRRRIPPPAYQSSSKQPRRAAHRRHRYSSASSDEYPTAPSSPHPPPPRASVIGAFRKKTLQERRRIHRERRNSSTQTQPVTTCVPPRTVTASSHMTNTNSTHHPPFPSQPIRRVRNTPSTSSTHHNPPLPLSRRPPLSFISPHCMCTHHRFNCHNATSYNIHITFATLQLRKRYLTVRFVTDSSRVHITFVATSLAVSTVRNLLLTSLLQGLHVKQIKLHTVNSCLPSFLTDYSIMDLRPTPSRLSKSKASKPPRVASSSGQPGPSSQKNNTPPVPPNSSPIPQAPTIHPRTPITPTSFPPNQNAPIPSSIPIYISNPTMTYPPTMTPSTPMHSSMPMHSNMLPVYPFPSQTPYPPTPGDQPALKPIFCHGVRLEGPAERPR